MDGIRELNDTVQGSRIDSKYRVVAVVRTCDVPLSTGPIQFYSPIKTSRVRTVRY